MLMHSKKGWSELQKLFEKKFDELALKLAIEEELSFSCINHEIESKSY